MLVVAVAVAVVALLGCVAYRSIKPPPTKICGTPDGPPITSPRVRLSDGRYLAYREAGVPKHEANYKIILCHGRGGLNNKPLSASREFIQDRKIYLVFFDRPGYGESDPNPSRSVKSEAFDIQELADELELGPRFYVIGCSLGGYVAWSCLKYIPHRLAGVSLVVPFVNYWWSGFPAELQEHAMSKLLLLDRSAFRVARYLPFLFHWWVHTLPRWFPSSTRFFGSPAIAYVLPYSPFTVSTQQGVYESLDRDVIAGFGEWEFSPLDLENPFPENEGSVDIWQGLEDTMIPYEVNEYIGDKLTWVNYHGVPGQGHSLMSGKFWCEDILKALINE